MTGRTTCFWPDDCPTVEECRRGCVVPAAASRDGSQVLSDASRTNEPLQTRQLPVVPDWVEHPDKWIALDRATRRQLERHHRRQRQ